VVLAKFANQKKRFYIQSPQVLKIVAFRGLFLTF
jgi:hypothetical protein